MRDLYTPFHVYTRERMSLQLNKEHADLMRSAGHNSRIKDVVQDQQTGNWFKIRGASCGLAGCMCDASATPIPDPTKEVKPMAKKAKPAKKVAKAKKAVKKVVPAAAVATPVPAPAGIGAAPQPEAQS